MRNQPPQDPQGQGGYGPPPGSGPPPPGYPQPGHQQQRYPQYPTGYQAAAPRSLDLAKIVQIGAWVVLGLFGLNFLYTLSQDDFGNDFGDRLFGGLANLGQGIFYTGALLAISVWLAKQQAEPWPR